MSTGNEAAFVEGFYPVLVSDFRILLGETLSVVDVPAKGGKEGIDEINPQLRFVVIRRTDLIGLLVEAFDEPVDGVGTSPHFRILTVWRV
jgi:hypothetical protein